MAGKQVPPPGKGAKVAAANNAVPAGLNNPWVVGTVPALLVGVFSPWLGGLPWWVVVTIGLWMAAGIWFWFRLKPSVAGDAPGPLMAVQGDTVGDLYGQMVTAFLGRVDRFFGDSDPARTGLFPRAFGLSQPAPLWTARSFDRTLVLSLLYPLILMFGVWVVSGKADILAQALGFRSGVDDLTRGVTFACIVISSGAMIQFAKTGRIAGALFFAAIALVAVFYPLTLGIFGSLLALVIGWVAGFVLHPDKDQRSNLEDVLYAVLLSACLCLLPQGFTTTRLILVMAATVAIVPSAVNCSRFLESRFGLGAVEIFILVFLLILSFAIPVLTYNPNPIALVFLFAVAILGLINAPFDWLALGITRGLLRRGQERGGWWPLWMGIADLLLSLAIVAVLAVVMLFAAQLFNAVTIAGGGREVFPVFADLKMMAAPETRGDPAFWWIYGTLFITQLPSAINLAIGAFAVLRQVRIINAPVDRMLVSQEATAATRRAIVAATLGGQVALGGTFGIAVTFGVVLALFFVAIPAAGGNIIDALSLLAEQDYPGRLVAMLSGR